jgi:tRNA pseudouridine38-40 synthase
VWHIPAPPLDFDAMCAAAACLEGQHDFAAFQGTGAVTHTTERVVFRSSIVRAEALVTYEIRGAGFLRHMVRNIVGTLAEIGRGRRPAAWMDEVLASGDRTQAGRTAPPDGLFLVGVEYDAQL